MPVLSSRDDAFAIPTTSLYSLYWTDITHPYIFSTFRKYFYLLV